MTSVRDRARLPFGKRGPRCGLLAAVLALAACAAPDRPTNPAADAAAAPPSAGSIYAGWRVFNDRCAACHGTDATGPAKVPGLLDQMRDMSARRFVNLVLMRYDWSPAPWDASRDEERADLVEDILRRKEAAVEMPAWLNEPQVQGHVLDLYDYLAARADGVQGPGRPAR
jgi:mono/diheme cytochrome c family protein